VKKLKSVDEEEGEVAELAWPFTLRKYKTIEDLNVDEVEKIFDDSWDVKVRADDEFRNAWHLYYDVTAREEKTGKVLPFWKFFEKYCVVGDLLSDEFLKSVNEVIEFFTVGIENPEEYFYSFVYHLNLHGPGELHVVEEKKAFWAILAASLMEKASKEYLAGRLDAGKFKEVKNLVRRILYLFPPHDAHLDFLAYHLFRRGLDSEERKDPGEVKKIVDLFREEASLLARRCSHVGCFFVANYLHEIVNSIGEDSLKSQKSVVASLVENRMVPKEVWDSLVRFKDLFSERNERDLVVASLLQVSPHGNLYLLTPDGEEVVIHGTEDEVKARETVVSRMIGTISSSLEDFEKGRVKDPGWEFLVKLVDRYHLDPEIPKRLFDLATNLKDESLRKDLLKLVAFSARTPDLQEKLIEVAKNDEELRKYLARNAFLAPHVLTRMLASETSREVAFELCFNNPLLAGSTDWNVVYFTVYYFGDLENRNVLNKKIEKADVWEDFTKKRSMGEIFKKSLASVKSKVPFLKDEEVNFHGIPVKVPDEEWLVKFWKNERAAFSLFNLDFFEKTLSGLHKVWIGPFVNDLSTNDSDLYNKISMSLGTRLVKNDIDSTFKTLARSPEDTVVNYTFLLSVSNLFYPVHHKFLSSKEWKSLMDKLKTDCGIVFKTSAVNLNSLIVKDENLLKKFENDKFKYLSNRYEDAAGMNFLILWNEEWNDTYEEFWKEKFYEKLNDKEVEEGIKIEESENKEDIENFFKCYPWVLIFKRFDYLISPWFWNHVDEEIACRLDRESGKNHDAKKPFDLIYKVVDPIHKFAKEVKLDRKVGVHQIEGKNRERKFDCNEFFTKKLRTTPQEFVDSLYESFEEKLNRVNKRLEAVKLLHEAIVKNAREKGTSLRFYSFDESGVPVLERKTSELKSQKRVLKERDESMLDKISKLADAEDDFRVNKMKKLNEIEVVEKNKTSLGE